MESGLNNYEEVLLQSLLYGYAFKYATLWLFERAVIASAS